MKNDQVMPIFVAQPNFGHFWTPFLAKNGKILEHRYFLSIAAQRGYEQLPFLKI
jgi:hypothetical protein